MKHFRVCGVTLLSSSSKSIHYRGLIDFGSFKDTDVHRALGNPVGTVTAVRGDSNLFYYTLIICLPFCTSPLS